jgi:two-component system response regulator YesN
LKRLAEICKNLLKPRSSNEPKDECSIISSTLDLLSGKIKEQEQKLEQSIPIIKYHFIQNLISSNTYNEDMIYMKMELLDIKFSFDCFKVVIIKLKNIHSISSYETSEIIKLHIMEKVESYLTDQNMKSYCSEANYCINVIINIKSKEHDITGNLNNLIEYIENQLKIRVNIGIGDTFKGFTNISASNTHAKICLNYSYIYPEVNIFTMKEVANWEHNSSDNLKYLYDTFCTSIKAKDKISTLNSILEIIDTIRKKHISYTCAIKTLTQCVASIEDTISDLKINPDNIIKSDIYTDYNNIDDIMSLKNWFIIVINQIFSQIDEKKLKKNSDLIKQVKVYISSNILEPSISLNYVAEAMHISPAYLSRIFKQETGTTFVEYLMDCKLNIDKDLLLKNSDMKIEELCNTIGYSSSQYFIRKFKVKFGITPNEFRLNHIRGNSL